LKSVFIGLVLIRRYPKYARRRCQRRDRVF